jgi:xylulokinase
MAQKEGVDPYEVMTREAMAAPRGCRGLVFLPYLMGERSPHLNPVAKGAFFGISAVHTRRDFIRSVMEGVGFALTDSMDIIRQMNVPVTEIRAGGGGGRSPLWRQMQADMFNLPVTTVNSTEGPALGVALLAAVGAGVYDTVPQACQAVITTGPNLLPDQMAGKDYALLHKVYQNLYTALKPSFDDIARLAAQLPH